MADANTVLESSPESEVQDSGFDLETASAEQYDAFMLTGIAPEAKQAESPPAKETIETPDESGKSKGNQEAGKGKGVKARTEQLDGEIQELEARLARKADLKRQLESEPGAKTGTPPAETKPTELKAPKRPKMEDFNGPNAWEDFEEAKLNYAEQMADFKAKVAVQEDRAQRAEEATREKQQAEERTRAEKWNERAQKAFEAHSDWDEKVGPIEQKFKSPEFAGGADILSEHEMGPETLYYLADHPDEFAKILTLRSTAQAAAVGLIAHSLTKPAQSVKAPPGPKKVTETPPPPSDLSGRNQLNPDPVKAALEADDTEAYMAAANAKDIADIAAGKRRSYR